MTLKSILLTLGFLLACLVGHAWGQVAVPDLIPAAPGVYIPQLNTFNNSTLTPDNPAVLGWGSGALVAGGLLSGSDDNPAAAGRQGFKGFFAGGRLHQANWAYAAEQTLIQFGSAGGLEPRDQSVVAQVSYTPKRWLSVGAGMGRLENTVATTDLTRVEAGASARLEGVWYLGFALYRDRVNAQNVNPQRDRSGWLAGVGVRIKRDWTYQAAYDFMQLNDFATIQTGGQTGGRLKLGLRAGPLLLETSQAGVDLHDSPDVHHLAFDAGWQLTESLVVTLRHQKTNTQVTLQKSAPERIVTTNSIAASWSF